MNGKRFCAWHLCSIHVNDPIMFRSFYFLCRPCICTAVE